MARPVGLLACVLAAVLTAAACAGRESPSRQVESPSGFETETASAPASESPSTEQASLASPGSAGLAVLDETIPEGPHGDYFPSDPSLTWLTCRSDIAWIGRITGYAENLLTTALWGPESRFRDVYDGLIFSVDELLVGDLDSGERPTIAFWALVVNEDGTPYARANARMFSILRPGVVQRESEDQPRYLVYGRAARGGIPGDVPGAFHLTHGPYGVARVREDGSLDGYAHRTVENARAAARALCVQPPLPPGIREVWRNMTGLSLNMGEALWVDRLTRACNAALGPDLSKPVWDQEAARALAQDFADEDGLRADLPPESRERFLTNAAGALWLMVVHRTAPDAPSVCWDRVPAEFLETGPPGGGWGLPPGFDTHMTEGALAELRRQADRMLWLVASPLPSGTREIWWDATGLRATILEHKWIDRLNRACNTPMEDPVWDRDAALALAEEFILEDGGEPSPELVEAGADALWRMTAEPPSGACSWHYPPGTFEPEFLEQMKEIRQAALS